MDVKDEARRLGFSDVRIAAAKDAEHAAEFRQWLEDGCHADMQWLARNADRRCSPELVVPGAKSVIVLALNYYTEPDDAEQPWTIVRYARGDDYHPMMEKKLKEFDAWLRERGGSQRCYVDTGPVLERDWATTSGLGWSGKSTMQIHPQLGTWFFLAVIVTTLEFPPDEAHSNRCGSCTRCLDACPTGAITPHRLDARKCLSYWSIEHRGSIPEEFRRAMGARLYGCEDCLTVCPWNRFARASREAAFARRAEVRAMKARDFLQMSEEEFRSMFQKSPLKRLKRSGFLRNVCVVLGNTGSAEDVPALTRAALDGDPVIAEHAAWALREMAQRKV